MGAFFSVYLRFSTSRQASCERTLPSSSGSTKVRRSLGSSELVNSLKLAGFADLRRPQLNRPDPPDCVCENQLGNRVAVEVAEVVCERAARLTAQGEDVFRRWRDGELRVHIERLLGEKNRKCYFGGPYSETIVCLFTDEPMLTPEQAISELSDAKSAHPTN